MLTYEEFARLVGNEEIIIEEVNPREDPLWVHTHFSRRLVAYPKHLWEAFAYDREDGLVLVHQWTANRMKAVIYRGIDPVNAAIIVQYLAATPSDLRGTVAWFTAHPQVAMTGVNLVVPYLVRNNTCIPFPSGRPTRAERMNVPM